MLYTDSDTMHPDNVRLCIGQALNREAGGEIDDTTATCL